MKTPDEIKKGLECFGNHPYCAADCTVNCDGCEFDTGYTARSHVMRDALAYIRQLEGQNAEQAARLEQVTRERDALKADILRATDKAKEMQSMLDDDVHPNCDYGLYIDLCDALGDVIAWAWRVAGKGGGA